MNYIQYVTEKVEKKYGVIERIYTNKFRHRMPGPNASGKKVISQFSTDAVKELIQE